MSAPILDRSLPGDPAGLAVALVLGIAFGWFLERAGLGSARKLAGQFYGTDLTVLRVMFSAILTAMLGVFWLGRLGWLDVARVHVPPTWLAPQAAGGGLFGLGFLVAGLCPGTSCVAAATLRLDGLAVAAGMLCGIFAFDEAFPFVRPFYESTPRGALTLPAVLGLPQGVVVAVVVAAALLAFAAAARLEGWVRRGATP